MMVMQTYLFLALSVLSAFIVIEAKPWCGLTACDSSEENEDSGTALWNGDNSSESNENEFDQISYTPDNEDKNYGQNKHFQDVNGPGGHGQGTNDLGGYIRDEYVPGKHGQGINGPGSHGQGINGPSGYVPGGYVPGGYVPGGYIPGGYIPSGYVPIGYVPTRYIPSRYVPNEYVPGGYIPSRYVPSGYVPIGYIPGEYFPVYNPGRYSQSGYVPGEFAPGVFLPGRHGPGNLSLDNNFRNFNNGHGTSGATDNEIGGHVSEGPCGTGGNLPCDGRQTSYLYNEYKGIDDVYFI